MYVGIWNVAKCNSFTLIRFKGFHCFRPFGNVTWMLALLGIQGRFDDLKLTGQNRMHCISYERVHVCLWTSLVNWLLIHSYYFTHQ